jgi:hypothetical protein
MAYRAGLGGVGAEDAVQACAVLPRRVINRDQAVSLCSSSHSYLLIIC